MKKIFTLLCGLALFGGCVTASAQQAVFEWKNGHVVMRSTEDVDSVTFAAPGLFNLTCSEASDVTNSSFSGTASVALGDGVTTVIGSWPTIGICYSIENTQPTPDDFTLWLGDEYMSYDFTLDNLVQGSKYYYRTYIKYCGDVYYSDTQTMTTSGEKAADKSRYINGHWFVDFGLPSGLLWADSNIGAATAADSGNAYAWGETTTKEEYSWANYKFGELEEITKYNETDKLTQLEASDDVATVSWGDPCRMPTREEFNELFANSVSKWTARTKADGTEENGLVVTSKLNGKSIFFPAGCFYWTSTSSSDYIGYAYYVYFLSKTYSRGDIDRNIGLAIRPVAAQ